MGVALSHRYYGRMTNIRIMVYAGTTDTMMDYDEKG